MANAAHAIEPTPNKGPFGGPAELALTHRTAILTVVLRVSGAAGAGLVAMVGQAYPARLDWVLAAVTVLLCWTCLFAIQVRRQGPRTWLFVGDAMVVSALCLFHDRLVPAAVLEASAGTGWVDMAACTSVFIAQFGLRQPLGLVAALGLTAGYAIGTPEAREAPVVMVGQALLAFGLMSALRRSARSSDLTLARRASEHATDLARSAGRADELSQQRLLHDTVLATLTMVSTGSIGSDSSALPRRAAADLAVIEKLRVPPGAAPDIAVGAAPTRLDLALRTVVPASGPGLPILDVEFDVPPLRLPRDVVVGISESVAEALTNVVRHAGTPAVRVIAKATEHGVNVEVRDAGCGFDVAGIPLHRRGLRESVQGRMRAVGGHAEVASRPGAGTAVVLRWPW